MKKKFRIVAGVKFYCDDKGVLLKDTEGFQEVPETDTEAEEVQVTDEAVGEVEKMLRDATAQVQRDAEKALGDSSKRASDAIIKMLDTVADSATKSAKVITDTTEKASFDVDSVLEGLKEFSEGKREKFTFSIKSIKDLNFLAKSTSVGDSLTGDVIEPQRVPELTRDPVRTIFIESIADVTANMTSDNLSYVEVVNESGAPLPTAELAQIPEKDFEFQEFKAPLKKITVMNKHSVEILKDAPQLVNAIKAWLQEDINIVTDQQLINGNGTGDNLQGVFGVASVLNGTTIGAKRVEFANLADVIRVAMTKIATSGKGKFMANYILLNPEDADELDLIKDENGQYVLPPFKSADGNTIKGARIIENVGIPVGTFLVGDFRKLHLGTKGGVEIEMTNSDGTDFAKDILAVKLRRRVASYVRQNDSGAFWTGNIATCKAALTQS